LEEAAVDVAILEVGLGGRLDAVNLVDADIAVITSIGLDHQDWLGDTRELIGREKAGIMRPSRPVVCGDLQMPASIGEEAQRLGAVLYRQGSEFGYGIVGEQGGAEGQIAVDDRRLWTWWGRTATGEELQLDQLPLPQLDVINAATALQVVALQPLAVGPDVVRQALSGLGLAGRFQRLEDPRHGIEVA